MNAKLLPIIGGLILAATDIVSAQSRYVIPPESFLVETNGHLVEIRVSNDVPISGLSIALSYDTEKLDIVRLQTTTVLETADCQTVLDRERGKVGLICFFGVDDLLGRGNDRLFASLIVNVLAAEPEELELSFEPFLIDEADKSTGIDNVLFDRSVLPVIPELENGVLTLLREKDVRRFVRGDADSNGNINLSDGVQLLEFLFRGGETPMCLDAADADDDGILQLTDAIRVFGWLFLGADPPPPPSPSDIAYLAADCDEDPSFDELGCDASAELCGG